MAANAVNIQHDRNYEHEIPSEAKNFGSTPADPIGGAQWGILLLQDSKSHHPSPGHRPANNQRY
jgi:hypothetical protein